MAASKQEIREWLQKGKKNGATHMLVMCDTFEHEDYPVFVDPSEVLTEKADKYQRMDMQKIMECYDLSMDAETQLRELRSWNGWGPY